MSKIRIMTLWLVLLTSGSVAAEAQQRQVTGQVLGDAEDPIAGAVVSVRGTRIGAITDEAGRFLLSAPAGAIVLEAQSVGYKTRRVELAAGENSVVIRLAPDALALEELVVTGHATTVARRNLAHAVSTVSARELDRAPAASLEKALQGKVAGALIQTNSGAPGGGVQVRLRGVSTINAVAEPLYVVDGVLISNAAIPSNANAVTRAAGGSNPSLTQDAVVNRVVDINPADIESVEILKGASAAAIYGSKAANGVIIITTKRGRPGETRFNATQRVGYFDLANTLGFRSFETADEAAAAFGDGALDFFGSDGRPLSVIDHEAELAGRNDLSAETHMSVSGGDADTRYFASGVWKNDEGIIANTGFEKQGARVNLAQRFGDRVDVSVNANVLRTLAERGLTNNDNSGTSFYMVYPFTPSFVDLRRCSVGSANPLCTADAAGTFPHNPFERSNPLQTAALMDNDEEVWRAIVGVNASIDLLRSGPHELRAVAVGGVDHFSQENELYFPPELQFEPSDGLAGTSLLSNSSSLNTNVTGSLIYTFAPADGRYRATTSAGYQYAEQDLTTARIISQNLPPGLTNVDAGTNRNVREQRTRIRDVAFSVQEEFLTYGERLLLTAGLVADRSSANGDPEEYFLYPKGSASFRFPEVGGPLDELKLRAAFGQSGNRPLYGQKFTPLRASENIEGLPGLVVIGTLGDPGVEPERTTEIEAGFDAVLFGERGGLQFTFFNKTVANQLLQREVAPSSGFVTEFFNGAEMRVRGLELALEATPVTGAFGWDTRATFYLDRSEVTHLPVPAFRTGGFGTALGAFEIREGESATQIVANVVENGKVTVKKVGDANPDFKLALANDFTWKSFNLYSLFDWHQGSEVINLTKLLFDFGQNTADYDADPQLVTEIAGVPLDEPATLTRGERRIRGFGRETRPYIEDGSFIKLRELSLGWQIPETMIGRVLPSVRSARLSLTGRNLITITDYTGLDPEVSNFGNQPIARNIDVAPFPPSRSFWLAVDVSF